ncbi:hypothetical protein MKK84_23800 [Methylobacterium sp. E-065]|uniref:hypothetical protein n=1 Tax=Methylobacterium sp. E-065 TaxID=2836583 RepID=UPI001FBA5A56|nr:hypothetical protein [Methylobacterium sp. E-065]MCJ2020418.1 hypothetical protein [Methylobacterium sp. E-065]
MNSSDQAKDLPSKLLFVWSDENGNVVPDSDGKLNGGVLSVKDGLYTAEDDPTFKIRIAPLEKPGYYVAQMFYDGKSFKYVYLLMHVRGLIIDIYENSSINLKDPVDRADLLMKSNIWVDNLKKPSQYIRYAAQEADVKKLVADFKAAAEELKAKNEASKGGKTVSSPPENLDKYGLSPADNSQNADTSEVTLCDQLASDPDDPNRMSTGIEFKDIVPLRALKACQDAVSQFPNTPRFYFQLGRAQRATNKSGDSIKSIAHASHMGYAAADYEFGFLYSLSQEDRGIAKARAFLHRAIDGGVTAAQTLLNSLEFHREHFKQGYILDSALNDKPPANPQRSLLYFRTFIDIFYNSDAPDCSKLVPSPIKVAADVFGVIGGFGEALGNPFGTASLNKDAENDALQFVKDYGCTGYVAKKMFSSIGSFVIIQADKKK